MRTEDQEFEEEFVGETNPSMLHFLLASGDEVQKAWQLKYLLKQNLLQECPCLAGVQQAAAG